MTRGEVSAERCCSASFYQTRAFEIHVVRQIYDATAAQGGPNIAPEALLVVLALLGGLSTLQQPVQLVGVGVAPLAHPVLKTR